jgi:hypothetical protein
MEPKGSSPHPQAHATCPYPELAPSSPHTHIPLHEKSILILSSHLRLGLPSGLLPSGMHMLQSLFYLTIVLHVSGIIITHLQEHRTTVTTASGNRYTVIELHFYR